MGNKILIQDGMSFMLYLRGIEGDLLLDGVVLGVFRGVDMGVEVVDRSPGGLDRC